MPNFFTNLRASPMVQHALRTLQFLSALISLALFSARLAKIVRLATKASHSNGAVEGILCAAVLYTLTVMLLRLCLKGGASKILSLLLIVLDLAFVGAFIAVAVLTSPKRGGSSGPCSKEKTVQSHVPKGVNCNLPWGTFILAIVSTILHALTALFHEVRDRHNVHKHQKHQGDIEQERRPDEGGLETQQTY